MAIFDIFEEVSERAVTKTETGENRIFGVVVGEVVNNYDDKYPGRVCVNLHTRDKDANEMKWARMAMPSGGAEWGHYFLPEIGDQVLVVFEEGIIDRPYVIGCIQKSSDKFLSKSKHKNNQHKRIVTRHGSAIEFEDVGDENDPEGDGTKDKIRIYTADEAHSVVLDNDKKLIEIKDKDENVQLRMKTENGDVTLKANKKITIKAGETITVVLNGENGKVTINCQDLAVDATGKINQSATGKYAISGAQVAVDTQGALKLSAAGMAQISGATIKLG